MVAAALPVSLMTAGPALAADQQASPAARPDEPLDDFAADPLLTGERLGELYPGRPGTLDLSDFPSADDFRDLPDTFLGLSGTLPGFPHHLGGPFIHGLRQHHRHHPFGPGFPWSPDPAPDLGDGALDDSADADVDVDVPEPSEPSDPPSAPGPAPAPVQRPPSRPTPAPHHRAPAASSAPSPLATDEPPRPPSRPRDLAGAPAPTPDRPASSPAPAPAPAPDNAVAGPEPAASPYALDAPGARVERVLPMGAGMALTGLGLAFLGLRLRRR
ncbi:hypothetical protein ACFVT2_02355 [Streptomyces sp. NPDC058000]|uniref:hypothetical protein n=1 Tax=Streptomyces sp. NPDC058000 TaxID=3346299 RepID=UPI0036F05CDB